MGQVTWHVIAKQIFRLVEIALNVARKATGRVTAQKLVMARGRAKAARVRARVEKVAMNATSAVKLGIGPENAPRPKAAFHPCHSVAFSIIPLLSDQGMMVTYSAVT